MSQRGTLEERFWKYVTVGNPDECWLWHGSLSGNRYGQLFVGSRTDGTRRNVRAHRLSWELHCGSIPSGMMICHTCDVPACVNPAHLFLGACVDNVADMYRKGRAGSGGAKGIAHPSAKLTEDQVREIRRLCASGVAQSEVRRGFGIGSATINYIVHRITWKHVT